MSLPSLRNAVMALGLASILAAGSSALTDNTIELLPHWKKGERIRFEIAKSRQRLRGDKVEVQATTRTDLEIEVLSVSKGAFVIAWTYGETKFDTQGLAENELVQRMANLLKGRRIVLELDSQAAIQGVQNWKELQENSVEVLDALVDELKAAGIDPTTLDQVRAQVAFMFSTKQQLELLGTREAQVFFMPMGYEFEGDKPVEFEDKLPNPFGGEPLPSHARIVLKEVDKKLGLANVIWNQSVSPADAVRILRKAAEDTSGKAGPPLGSLENVTIEDKAEFSVEIPSGWIRSCTHTRVVRTGEASQTDVITFARRDKGK